MAESSSPRFTMRTGEWYGLTMYPGYGNEPYHSPIQIHAVTLLGDRTFALVFLNLAYAAGVQKFEVRLRTLRRTKSHQVAEVLDSPDRTYVLVPFSKEWLRAHFPNLRTTQCFGPDGRPVDLEMYKLASTAW